ncbi:hypothetical protein SEA_APHELION_146 [Gordonia phage Aphelion]|uniref:Uncharacterized protein n=1 Tax=Gordonia phage Aphelion TaxID=2507860 RepID=A0A410TDA2_9CAUD|nr:hypothetical protein SEA_APHELION_146 [Gordonia phage Aphelion]
MSPLDITKSDIGRSLRIETKVKSKPIRGKVVEVINHTSYVRVELQTGFATRGMMLTADNDVSFED